MSDLPVPVSGETVPQEGTPLSIEGMIALAISHGTPVETMERLLAMRTQLREEQAREAYDRALAAVQAAMPVIPKSAEVKNKDGKSVRYRFTPIEDIKRIAGPILAAHGFSWSFDCQEQDGKMLAICIATHEGGHSRTSTFPTPIDADSYMSAPQRHAAALTFGKRYALCGAFGIVCGGEDNDAAPDTSQDNPRTENAPRPAPAQARTPDTSAPACPVCSGPMYDNRAKNDEREAAGQKRGPDWKCKAYKSANCEGVYWQGQWPPAEQVAPPPVKQADPRQTVMQELRDLGHKPSAVLAQVNRMRESGGIDPLTTATFGQANLTELCLARDYLLAGGPEGPQDLPGYGVDPFDSSPPSDGDPFPDSPESVYARLREQVAPHAKDRPWMETFSRLRESCHCTATTLTALCERRKPGPGDNACLRAILDAMEGATA